MLRYLRIRNLAVIESVEVEFEAGFNVLTGETGAGKSILVEAVGLLLGGRASADLVRTGEPQATIEAMFEESGGGELVVRREISNQGRSRSFINGALATAGALRDLSQRLVELHGQHEHQELLDPLAHLPLLDSYAHLGEEAARVAEAWGELRMLRDQLDRSRMDGREKAARLELIAFQLSEIERAAPKPGEDEELAATKQVLASAERVQRLCEESYAALYESDGAVLSGLGGVWKRVGELATLDPQFTSYVEARDSIKSQLEDLAFFLRSYADGIDASPGRLQQVEDRLMLLERLKRKHGPTLQDVIATGESLRRERDILTGASENTEELQRKLQDTTGKFLDEARLLSKKRREAAVSFAAQLEALLGELAMSRTRFEVRFNDRPLAEDAWSERGIDQAEFFISPNPGEELRPLARIVSGGELSRVMLALKTIAVGVGAALKTRPYPHDATLGGDHAETARRGTSSGGPKTLSTAGRGGSLDAPETLPTARRGGSLDPPKTLIFDEVDAGIGGRIADVVGARLRDLGSRFQVLCITHLPQIAARGNAQFRIEKHVRGKRTVTTVDPLDDAGRVEEIARMIGGAAVTDAVRASARELLGFGAEARDADRGGASKAVRVKEAKAKGESESRWRRNT